MKTVKISALLCVVLILLQSTTLFAQSLTVLHEFGSHADGQFPSGGLVLCGSTLYGVTQEGDNGSGYNSGILYSVNTNGSNYTIVYDFGTNGQNPNGLPVITNGWIYGTTYDGGLNYNGVIYRVGTNGSNYSVLHAFDNGAGGMGAEGDLLLVGNTLFGTTKSSASNSTAGAIFAINTNGSNFNVVFSFTNNQTDGNPTYGKLAFNGSTLYGTCSTGGSNHYGFVYSVLTNGSNFKMLHSFDQGDGATPMGSALLSGGTLYGTTELGGSNGLGTIYAIGSDGSNYRQIYAFQATDGYYPYSTLTLVGNTLYGAAGGQSGGKSGAVFSVNTNGGSYQVIYNFSDVSTNGFLVGTNSDGSFPWGTLLFSGNTLYGITQNGGTGGVGTVFGISLPTNSAPAPFFTGQVSLGGGWYWLGPQGSNQYGFGYYNLNSFPYVYHLDLGYEYFFDANNAARGAYFYDFASNVFLYTEPDVFPYMYDFHLNAWDYYLPQTGATDEYSTGPRWFCDMSTGVWMNNP